MVTGTYTDAVSVTKKNPQIQCAVTETHIDIVHSHWNTNSAWSLEHTQCMVTGTHSAWSEEHRHSIRSVKHTYILGIVSSLTRSADIYHEIYIPKKN